MLVPRRTIKAPTPVIKVATPFHASRPVSPDWVIVAREIAKRRLPITTFGCPNGVLNFDTKNAKDRNIKGRKMVDQPKY
jgi:hypothetical protein